ncbi:MAG: alginate export family protein [Oceanobacter sp.]
MFPVKRLSVSWPAMVAGAILGSCSFLTAADGLTNWPLLMPGSVYFDGHLRGRIESLDDQYRATGAGTDQVLAVRTDLKFTIPMTRFRKGSDVVLEVMDSRQFSANDDTTLTTSTVNTLELVQARVSLHSDLLPWQGGDHRLNIGRQTLDLGSRRLVARNRYRNTLNTFDGLHAISKLRYSDARIEGLVFYPVTRYPVEREDLDNNQHEADKSSLQVQLLGLSADGYVLAGRIRGALQWLKLRESDTHRLGSRNRNLHTLAGRLYVPPKAGRWSFDLELMHQTGRSRASTDETDHTDLDHKARFYHLELGYRFRSQRQWQILAQYDYASGDSKPDDEENNRFDTLYGARRFDFGPTGIFGSMARANIVSPALRISLKPTPSTDLMLVWRWYRLASEKDAWVGSGYQDVSGKSGDDVGNQPEFRWRWSVSEAFQIETGAAWLNLGSYARKASEAAGNVRAEPVPEQAVYSYLQANWLF